MRQTLMQPGQGMCRHLISGAASLGSVVGLLALILLLAAPDAVAKQSPDRKEHWSEWKALSKGYVGRRKVPENVDQPVAERRQERVEERLSNLKQLSRRLEREETRAREQEQSRGGDNGLRGRRDGFKGGRSSYEGSRSAYSGARSKYGENRAEIARQRSALEQRIRELEQAQRREREQEQNSRGRRGEQRGGPPSRAQQSVWLRTGVEGLHAASMQAIAGEMDLNPNQLRARARSGRLGLTRAGTPVSWYFDDESDSILFAAPAYETFHSEEDAYRLSLDGDSGAMSEIKGRPTGAVGSERPFREVLHFEEEPDMQYSLWAVAAEADADYWFWDYLYGGFKDVIEVALYVPDPADSGTAKLQVSLRGWTDLEEGDEHQVYAELNGVQVGSVVTWDGFQPASLVAEFDQSLLNSSGQNTLKLRNIYSSGSHPGQFLDEVAVEYLRQPVAWDGALWLHGVGEGVQTVRGLSASDIVVVESPLDGAVVRSDARVEPDGDGGYSATFEVDEEADYLIAERGVLASPSMELDEPAGLDRRDNVSDYLIIAPRELAASAEALAEYRKGRFGSVRIVWLHEIYSEFSHGRVDPFAITRFMETVQQRWRVTPTHVVLVGKGSLDHKDRMGYSDSFLPTVMSDSPWVLSASDQRLLSGEGDADFAIGRIPITNDTEGLAYVDKLAAYESATFGPERLQAVLAADNPDAGGEFHANTDVLGDRLTGSLGFDGVTKLYHPRDSVRQNLVLSSTWETGYVSYDGHGSATQVGDGRENFLKATDADALSNATLPVFTALTCSAGNYALPGTRSLAGSLVLSAGGAIASLAPTGESLDSDAQVLNNAFTDGLFGSRMTVGDAARQAKLQTKGQISGYTPRIYGIVGDPSVYAR